MSFEKGPELLNLVLKNYICLLGNAAGNAFASNAILTNPVSNLMMRILATVLLKTTLALRDNILIRVSYFRR